MVLIVLILFLALSIWLDRNGKKWFIPPLLLVLIIWLAKY